MVIHVLVGNISSEATAPSGNSLHEATRHNYGLRRLRGLSRRGDEMNPKSAIVAEPDQPEKVFDI